MEVTMSLVHQQVLDANLRYAREFGAKAGLGLPPARRFAILTCMDARLDPAGFAGLAEGDAHVIRNAGGRASDDAIRSLVISHKLLGTAEWFVIHHTNCGMQLFDDGVIGELLTSSLHTAELVEGRWHNVQEEGGSLEGRYVRWLAFKDLEASVREDVARIKHHPLVPGDIPVYGYIYDVHSGQLLSVPTGADSVEKRAAVKGTPYDDGSG
jgi:carbonic anhydrase